MKQALNPKMPKMGSTYVSDKELSVEELTYHLEKTQGGVMLASQKKKFLLNVLTNKTELLELCKVFDSFMNTGLENAISISIGLKTIAFSSYASEIFEVSIRGRGQAQA